MNIMSTGTVPEHRTIKTAAAKQAPNCTCERARMLKPLADEAHKILVIGRESDDGRLIALSAEVMTRIMEAL